MTEEEEYIARNNARHWTDDRVLRLIRRGFLRVNDGNERTLMRLFQYMRDDYEEEVAKLKTSARKREDIFDEVLANSAFGEEDEEAYLEKWHDKYNWV